MFFYTRLWIFKWSVSASIRSWEDFRTTASMYFFMGNSIPIDIRLFEHLAHRFECVKVITSSSNDRGFSEISILFIEFYCISLIFFDFCWFSMISIDFTIISRRSFRHLMTLSELNWYKEFANGSETLKNGTFMQKYVEAVVRKSSRLQILAEIDHFENFGRV